MKVLVAGGTGLIGGALLRLLLARGHRASVLSRDPGRPRAGAVPVEPWEGRSDGPWRRALKGADAVVNLCGEGVAERPWTAARRRLLLESRLEPTRALVSAMAEGGPKVLVNASAVGYYGNRGQEVLTEDSPPGKGFLAELCLRWEEEALRARALGARTVLLRLGVVLSPAGGALRRMLPFFRLGLGGRLGSGRQRFPWIHLDDAAGLILAALETPALQGPVNAVSPGAADNAAFAAALGRALRRPAILPVPAFALRLALGEMSGLLLESQRVEPRAALAAGYRFLRPSLEDAFSDL